MNENMKIKSIELNPYHPHEWSVWRGCSQIGIIRQRAHSERCSAEAWSGLFDTFEQAQDFLIEVRKVYERIMDGK